MKLSRLFKTAALLLLLTLLALALVSCDDDLALKEIPDIKSYTIMYPDECPKEIYQAAKKLTDTLKDGGIAPQMEMKNDFILSLNPVAPTDTLEILIGDTNRLESEGVKKSLKNDDFTVFFENNRLVINGGSPEMVAGAVDWYIETCIKDGKAYYPEKGYRENGSYRVDTITLGGADLKEYAIVRSKDDVGEAEYLAAAIRELSGINLEILSARESKGEYEILLGNTGREESEALIYLYDSYRYAMNGKKLVMGGDGKYGAYNAVYAFVEAYLMNEENKNLTLSVENTTKKNELGELVRLNLPEVKDLTSVVPEQMSQHTVLTRFLEVRDELPKEVTVLNRIDLLNYPESMKTQIYVSTTGNDNNAGTKEAPLKTIGAAVRKMSDAEGGVIWVMGGTYELQSSIELNSKLKSSIFSPLFIKAYEDQDVTLTSNKVINGESFILADPVNDVVAERLPDSAIGKVYMLDLHDIGWTDSDIMDVTTSGPAKLYVDGKAYDLARYPNATDDIKDLMFFTKVYNIGRVTTRDGSDLYFQWLQQAADSGIDPMTEVGWEIQVAHAEDPIVKNKGWGTEAEMHAEEILNWVNTGNIWFYGSTFEGWEFGYYNIDPKCVHDGDFLGSAMMGGYYSLKSLQSNPYGAKHSTNSPAGRNTFYLFNAIEALDAPGEWFIDKDTGFLYIYPEEEIEDIKTAAVSYSGTAAFSLVNLNGASNVVIDGIDVDGAGRYGYAVSGGSSVILQNCNIKNTKNGGAYFTNTMSSAIIYCEFSQIDGTMVVMNCPNSNKTLTPTDNVVQNNYLHDPRPTKQGGISIGGFRVVVSHNYLVDTQVNGSSALECIVEYNRFDGGSKDITDGGMLYFGGDTVRGNHYRYNLFQKFNATHNAVYNDGMACGNYTYGNIICTLGGSSTHKAWYSSSGQGNVCYGNYMILSEKDNVNQSALFYYYYGNDAYPKPNEFGLNSLAGHWWVGKKEVELRFFFETCPAAVMKTRFPDSMRYLEGTKLVLAALEESDYKVTYDLAPRSEKTFTYQASEPTYVYVPAYAYLDEYGDLQYTVEERYMTDENNQITLRYDQIAAMERLRRQGAYCVVSNNLILGSKEGREIVNDFEDGNAPLKGIIEDVQIEEDNYILNDYRSVLQDIVEWDYTISEEGKAAIVEEMGQEFMDYFDSLDPEKAGPTENWY